MNINELEPKPRVRKQDHPFPITVADQIVDLAATGKVTVGQDQWYTLADLHGLVSPAMPLKDFASHIGSLAQMQVLLANTRPPAMDSSFQFDQIDSDAAKEIVATTRYMEMLQVIEAFTPVVGGLGYLRDYEDDEMDLKAEDEKHIPFYNFPHATAAVAKMEEAAIENDIGTFSLHDKKMIEGLRRTRGLGIDYLTHGRPGSYINWTSRPHHRLRVYFAQNPLPQNVMTEVVAQRKQFLLQLKLRDGVKAIEAWGNEADTVIKHL